MRYGLLVLPLSPQVFVYSYTKTRGERGVREMIGHHTELEVHP